LARQKAECPHFLKKQNVPILLALLVAGCGADRPAEPDATAAAAEPEYVGAAACENCHANEVEAWRGSHHDLAMQPATEATVLGDFGDAEFSHHGVTSSFSKRDGSFFVRTDGPDGVLAEFPVRYTFGVDPLQQYLVELPDGKIQALGVAWDSRAPDAGGQRWFHVYGDEPIDHTDVLHWTRLSQNWDTMCADCHSTGLEKRYDVEADRFDTSWAEINVACEACHGPASQHLAWAKSPDDWPGDSSDKGLVVMLDERRDVAWLLDEVTGNSQRSESRVTATEIATCAPCHSRRSRIADPGLPGGEFLDTYVPALIQPPLYHADGQVRDEVYVYGSFLQSRMYQQGVTCSDCHEPHTLRLRAPGAQMCQQCHQADKYATTDHHRHPVDSRGASCIECHMPPNTFMQVDARHDHSFRIPRLQLSAGLGTPEPCTQCHADKDANWALAAWYGDDLPDSRQAHWSMLLAADSLRVPGAAAAQRALVEDLQVPDIVRATAVGRLASSGDPASLAALAQQILDPNPMVRWAAARALQDADVQIRATLGVRLLADPVRVVRMEAAISLAALGPEAIPPGRQADFQTALDEYIAAQVVNAERPEAHVNLGNVYQYLNRGADAEQEYRIAMRLNPYFLPAYVNLADYYRLRDREQDGEEALRAGLALLPDQPALHQALGLLLVRTERMEEALNEFRTAAESPAAEPRFALAYALALDAQGETDDAIVYLEAALERFGADQGLVAGLVNLYQRAGKPDELKALQQRLGGGTR
jgi:tetratricopeptide (TPR) repeat protein